MCTGVAGWPVSCAACCCRYLSYGVAGSSSCKPALHHKHSSACQVSVGTHVHSCAALTSRARLDTPRRARCFAGADTASAHFRRKRCTHVANPCRKLEAAQDCAGATPVLPPLLILHCCHHFHAPKSPSTGICQHRSAYTLASAAQPLLYSAHLELLQLCHQALCCFGVPYQCITCVGCDDLRLAAQALHQCDQRSVIYGLQEAMMSNP